MEWMYGVADIDIKKVNYEFVSQYEFWLKSIRNCSRYQAARLANRESLLLYLKTGNMLSEKMKAEKWGAKVLDQISTDLQNQLPGLRGFSSGNLKKMRIFAEEYGKSPEFGSLLTNQLKTKDS